MAITHLSVKRGLKGKGEAHAHYVAGLGKYAERDDVRHVSDRNLPGWAADGAAFFAAADQLERKGGRVYTEIEFAIPREADDPIQFAAEFAERLLGQRHAYRLAVHDKPAADGGRNIHAHLMFTERVNDGIDRSVGLFFKRAATAPRRKNNLDRADPDPALGGAPKDRTWNERDQVQRVREFYQAHAQRFGVELDMRSNQAKGMGMAEPKIGVTHGRSELNAGRKARKATVEEIRANRAAPALTPPGAGAAGSTNLPLPDFDERPVAEFDPRHDYSGPVLAVGTDVVVVECNGRTGEIVRVPAELFRRLPEPGKLAFIVKGQVKSIKTDRSRER